MVRVQSASHTSGKEGLEFAVQTLHLASTPVASTDPHPSLGWVFEETEAQRGQGAFLGPPGPGRGQGQNLGYFSPLRSAAFLPMERIPPSLVPEGSWGHEWVTLENKAQPALGLSLRRWESKLATRSARCVSLRLARGRPGLAAAPPPASPRPSGEMQAEITLWAHSGPDLTQPSELCSHTQWGPEACCFGAGSRKCSQDKGGRG